MIRFLLILSATLIPFVASANEPAKPVKKRVVGILIFEGVEALDFCGPYEVFSLAHRHVGDKIELMFDVRVVAATAGPITARGGLKIVPNNSLADCPKLDILVVPGGKPASTGVVLKDPLTRDWLRKQAAGAELVTSVCTGAFVLAEAGLLDGKRAATHQLSLDDLRAKYPKVTVVGGARVVEDGKVVTAAGVSSGLDMALRVVARLHGDDTARMVATIIEYPYTPQPK